MEMGDSQMGSKERSGIAAGIACYALWGILPLYWKLLANVNPLEVIAQRIIWCFVFTVGLCLILRMDFMALLRDRRARRYLIPSAILGAINSGFYIYAVSIDHIIETSIGYYLNPLVSIVLGIAIFKERLAPLQVAAVALCSCGIVLFTIGYGSFPWIAVVLAVAFGAYGAVKKKGGYPASEALAVENTIQVIPALAIAFWMAAASGDSAFFRDMETWQGWQTTLLLIGGGLATAVPLLLFARAANYIPLTILGFTQYISPTLALMVGVLFNGEQFTAPHAVCFALIWAGLALVLIDSVRRSRVHRK